MKEHPESIGNLLKQHGVYHLRDANSPGSGKHAMFSPDGRYLGHLDASGAVRFLDQRAKG